MKFKTSIKNKILLSFVALVSLLLVFQIGFNFFFASDFYKQYKMDAVEEAMAKLENSFDGTSESIETIAKGYEDRYNIEFIAFSEDQIVYSSFERDIKERAPDYKYGSMNNAVATVMARNILAPPHGSGGSGGAERLELIETITLDNIDTTFILTLPLLSIEDSAAVFSESSFYISLIVVTIGIIISAFISSSITKPIKEMEAVASSLSNLDFSSKVSDKFSSKELSSLATSINSMSTQLENTITELSIANEKLKLDIDYQKQIEEMRREFVGNVSHEMKTPLSLMQIYAESLKYNIDSLDKDFYCDTIIEETEKLSAMVSSMLDISSIESGLSQMNIKDSCISDTTLALISKMTPMLEPFDFTYDIESDVFAQFDEKYIEQAMKNYITNAIQYTEQGKEIYLQLVSSESEVVFSIINEAPSIPNADMPKLWESFYRADKARQRSESNNVGLGLHIVKTIIQKHSGSFGCMNVDEGVLFEFRLPINQEKPM